MADILLNVGGNPHVAFPACAGQQQYGCKFPTQVEAEFGQRGYFTAARVLSPATQGYQAEAFKTYVAGDFVGMFAVPEKMALTSIFTEVMPTAPRSVHDRGIGCASATMAGVTYDVVAFLYDNETCTKGAAVALPAALAGIDANVAASYQAFKQVYVPAGKTLMLGIELLTAPSGAGLTFSDMAGLIALVAKVEDYQYPWII
jgi:hypothetical protein